MTRTPAIAVIGMGCVYPGARSPEELWHNVLAGRRYFRRAPSERLPLTDYYSPDPTAPDKTYCDQMAVITGWTFDPVTYRIAPTTAESSDLTHWLALDTAAAAIRDARLDLDTMDRTRVGVVLGNTLAGEFARSHYLRLRWPYVERAIRRALATSSVLPEVAEELLIAVRHHYSDPLPQTNEDFLAGNMANTIAGRICNYFDLGGLGYVVDGACSSSLLAVAAACEHLVAGDLDIVITGGVDISLDPFEMVGFAKTQALAVDQIRPYDVAAGGMLPGEGCGLVVLQLEKEACRAGRRVYALVRGWGVSSDGAGGITAPKVEGQVRSLRRAYARSGYSIGTVGLIEGHGTGTPVGDRVELSAIRLLLEEESSDRECWIGSIKGNIGHCKAASGAAGLIKAVMALQRKVLPPTAGCRRPSPVFGPLPRTLRPSLVGGHWDSGDLPRRAGISAFGFGGSNCHVTLEEANPADPVAAEDLALLGSSQASELFLLSAADQDELVARAAELAPVAERICLAEMGDLAAALASAAGTGRARLSIVAETPAGLAQALRRAASQPLMTDSATGLYAGNAQLAPALVALYPGQGSQRLNMGESWGRRYPFVQTLYQDAEEAIKGLLSDSLASYIWCDPDALDETQSATRRVALEDTRIAQPAVVLMALAALRVLRYFGLHPMIHLGHSLGEISALCAAGACSEKDAIRLAALRGQAIANLALADPGNMAAVAASAAEVEPMLAPFRPDLVIANYNAPRQTVVSGPTPAVEAFVKRCEAGGLPCRRLPVSHAFHSPLVAPAASAFHAVLGALPFAVPQGSIISTARGQEVEPGCDLRALLSDQLRQPVRFVEAVAAAQARRPVLWIEVGPGGVLTNLVGSILDHGTTFCLPMDMPDEDPFHLLNHILARAWILGFPLKTSHLFAGRLVRPFNPEAYRPIFIVNPCERSADRENRKPFSIPAIDSTPAETITADNEGTSTLAFARDWLVERTGFPPAMINAQTRLRTDLNLDSIKSAQLLLLLCQKLGKRLPSGPTTLANATLADVVEAVRAAPPTDAEEGSAPTVAAGAAPWVRIFAAVERSAPWAADVPLPQPEVGSVAVISAPGCPLATAIATTLSERGFSVLQSAPGDLLSHRAQAPGIWGLVFLVPGADQVFSVLRAPSFTARVDGLATDLFLTFSWLLHWRPQGLEGVRCLALRPVLPGDPSADMDAGGAFLRSLQLEESGARLKWLSYPASWSSAECAAMTVRELERWGPAVIYRYRADGERTTPALGPASPSSGGLPPLGSGDVILVPGGAKGITAMLAYEIARQSGAALALLGTTPMPDRASGDEEVRGTLERLRQARIPFCYERCDVRDRQSVRRAIGRTEARLGSVSAILHGAGAADLRRFADMDLGAFLNVIRVKAVGLYNLLSAVELEKLKALHVISSVLGHTGMRGQSHYAFANAWLDGAVESLGAAYPGLHRLSLGYSVWEGVGMGRKLGPLLDMLLSAGVTALPPEDAVAAYGTLLRSHNERATYVITGRLTAELERWLFPGTSVPRGRFLTSVVRHIPGTELVAEAVLDHDRDRYLSEHVFEGSPIFPGVMALEAMAQVAMACGQIGPLRAVRNVAFRSPIMVLEGAKLRLRTAATVTCNSGGAPFVRAAMWSEVDGYANPHYEADFFFGPNAVDPVVPPPMPDLGDPMALDPATFHPVPLFQGEFFRLITAIHRLEPGRETLTRVRVPQEGDIRAGQQNEPFVTGCPALRDAYFQSGAIGLPPRLLPTRVDEAYIYRVPALGSEVICWCHLTKQTSEGYSAEIDVYTPDGEPVESLRGIVLRCSASRNLVPDSLSYALAEEELEKQLPGDACALALVCDAELERVLAGGTLAPIPDVKSARRRAAIGNEVAAQRAASAFAARWLERVGPPAAWQVHRNPDGRPELLLSDAGETARPSGLHLSLADTPDLSGALVSTRLAGLDIEPVVARDDATWRGLLGDAGYPLALRLAALAPDSLDRAATCAWTVLEAAKKAGLSTWSTAGLTVQLDGSWLVLSSAAGEPSVRIASTVISSNSVHDRPYVLTVLVH